MQAPSKAEYTLGLDIGMASVGAALITHERILALHVRTFDKAETAKEGESLNVIRREARLTRRRIRRRAHRLLRLRRLFKRTGLLDSQDPAALFTGKSPWMLRAEGLDRRLASTEWGAALYHLVKHRGFQSSRKSEAKADEKTGQMLSGISRIKELLANAGLRTVGELAARHEAFAAAKRNKGGAYTQTFARADLAAELGLLFAAQRRFGNPHADAAFEDTVLDLLMARRPALSGERLLKTVGKCTFEPTEFRAPKASHSAERFVWLTRLNNLRVSGLGETRALIDSERAALMELPFAQAKLTYNQARKLLRLAEHERFAGLDYRDKDPESATLFEAKAFHVLRKAYEEAGLKPLWQRDALDPERLDTLAYAQTVFKEDGEARAWLAGQGVEPEIIETVLNVAFSDFVRLSTKALRRIIPHMETGLRYDEAVRAAGYAHHSQLPGGEKTLTIPRISKDDFPNPVVYRALNQARKLVNAIVHEYGSPTRVHIELARDLSKSFDERKRIEREQKSFRENKQKDIADFVERFGFTPKGADLVKWRLYREQNAQCAYSQKAFDLDRLFEDGYAEIDHILPYSRSFDDGMNNKVLVHTVENRNKGNRTPYEYLDGQNDSESWRRFATWVMGNKSYRQAKRQRLLRKDFGEAAAREFRERHITDTRHIARSFKHLVERHLQLAGDANNTHCVVLSGQLTAFLRARWGLLKVRENGDLHHALDAAVVAACSQAMVKRLSDYSRRGELEQVRNGYTDPESGEILDLAALRRLEAQFPTPWPHFREELLAWLSDDPATRLAHLLNYPAEEAKRTRPVRVSRAPTRRGTGQAHQETIRSAKWLGDGVSAVKTPLENLKLKDIEKIAGFGDPRNTPLIKAIRQRLEQHGNDGKKAFKEPLYKPSRPGKAAPVIRSVKLLDTQKSGLSVRGGVANNVKILRVDIFTDGKRFHAIPLYVADAVKVELPNRAVVQGKPEEEWTVMGDDHVFLFSLHPNDWVAITLKGTNQPLAGYFAGLDRSTGAISLWTHDRNQSVAKDGLIRGIGIKTAMAVEKFHVDMLGRLHRVRQETRQPLRRAG